jgi:hypothetical protein
MMFSDEDFAINLAPVSSEPQLVLIPVSDEYGVMAVAKTFGNGKAACIVFAPAVKLGSSFDGYTPKHLRKILTSDFALRSGGWSTVKLSKNNSEVLRRTVFPLMSGLEELHDEDIETISMHESYDLENSPAVATNTYRPDETTPFEKAVCHMLDIKKSNSNKSV